MRGLEKNCTRWRTQTDKQTHGHGDSMTESAQWGRFSEKLIKHPRLKHLNTGTIYGCSLMTRIWVGRSYSIGLEIDNACSCDNITQETLLHYMFCTKYTEQRLLLYQRIEQIIPNIRKLSLKRQYEICIYGYEITNPEMTKINRQIMIATQTYILRTKRFDNCS